MPKVFRPRLAAATLTAVGLAAAAPAAEAVHWPFFGGDNGRSGYQPVDEGTVPVGFLYSKTGATEAPVQSSIITSAGAPAAQRVIFGTADGTVHLQILATGAPVGPEEGTRVDDGAADGDVFGTPGTAESVSFAETSGPAGPGQVFAAHNDDGAGADPDIEIAQLDEGSGSRMRPDVDVAGTDGFTVESSLVATGPAPETGNRTLFFVASNGADRRLFRVPVTNNAASSGATIGTATNTGDIDATPLASPTIMFLDVDGTPTAHVAVGTTDRRVRTFRADTLAAGPASADLGGPVQTPSVPVQPSGFTPNPADPVKTAPFIYVAAATAAAETTAHQLRQDGGALETVASSPALAGAPAPALATDQESEAPAPEQAKVIVTTGANLYLLTTDGLDRAGQLDRESDLDPGTTGFSQTTAVASGEFAYVTDDQSQQIVLRLADGKPVGADEFAQATGNAPAANTGVGQPSISRGFIQFAGGSGVFVYRNTDAIDPTVNLTAPADGATVSGTVTLAAQAFDARGIANVTFRLNGQPVGQDTTPDSGAPFAAPGATFSTQLDTTRLANGTYILDAVATDGGRRTATSTPRRLTVQNGDGGPAAAADDDRPPAVAFGTPAQGSLVRGTTTLSATANDDRGVRSVAFFDDDRLVCTDTTAPYSCTYTARGDDVGRDTLFAVATDTAGQTAAAVRTIRVDRFTPTSLTARTTPGRDRRVPYRFRTTGRLVLPGAVSSAAGCDEGVVLVRVKAKRKTISTRRAALKSDCTFTSAVSFRDRDRFTRDGRLTFRVRFTGNDVLTPRSARTRAVRTR